jgi:beta-lactamase superfamily II metal-dependent hydrolase
MTAEHHITVFNVQHGACALWTTKFNGVTWTTMIDCGHMNNARGRWFPGDFLRSQGITTLDLLIVSNLDEDHVSGLPNLLERGITITNIFSNPSVQPWQIRRLKEQHGMGAGIDALVSELTRRGLLLQLQTHPGAEIYCAWNEYLKGFEDENNLSVLTSITIDGYRFLFTGDMECAGFNHVLRNHKPIADLMANVDVLVAPHHGRENGLCPDLFSVYGCNPRLVVISDDYKQHDTQHTSGWYLARTRGHPFKFGGGMRWVLTTRSDGTLDFITGHGLFAY